MDTVDDDGGSIVSLVRGLLDKTTAEQAGNTNLTEPASSPLSPGWHPMLPQGTDTPSVAAWQPWTGLRPVDVVQAKGLILIIFEDEDEAGGDVYLYAEPLAGYADLQMEDRQVASLIVVHLEELLGGVGWQQHVPALRLGRLVLLKPSTLTSTA